MHKPFLFLQTLMLLSCGDSKPFRFYDTPPAPSNPFVQIESIPPAVGFTRINQPPNSFGDWLRHLPIRKDNRVLLYNGHPKEDQSSHLAVLDLPIGNKDLQQCADAAMRLRADYHFSQNHFDSISFRSTSGQLLSFTQWRKGTRYKLSGNKLVAYTSTPSTLDARSDLTQFLDFAFQFCGTLSLQRDLHRVTNIQEIEAGDVFVKGGSPGHAMTVVDMAIDRDGHKSFLLAQGFMPAQDIHIVRNPSNPAGGPWYSVEDIEFELVTPGWTFTRQQLYRW